MTENGGIESPTLEQLSVKAQEEIGEAEVDTQEALRILKELIRDKYKGLRLPPNFDDFLLRCLRAGKFDQERAAKTASEFFLLMNKLKGMDMSLMPSHHPNLKGLGQTMLKYRDSEGRAVILFRQELLPAAEYPFNDVLAAGVLLIDQTLRSSVETQRLGVVFVCDYHGYSLAHLRQTSIASLKAAAKMFQGAFPARFKAVHFVRNPFLVGCMYSLVRPFLKEKLKQRIHFHGYDMKELHKHVSPSILPEYLGGELPDDDYADRSLNANLMEQDDYYKSIINHGYA